METRNVIIELRIRHCEYVDGYYTIIHIVKARDRNRAASSERIIAKSNELELSRSYHEREKEHSLYVPLILACTYATMSLIATNRDELARLMII